MNNSEFSGEPQVFPLIQALFVDNDWTCLESLLDENIQWHATEPRRDYSASVRFAIISKVKCTGTAKR